MKPTPQEIKDLYEWLEKNELLIPSDSKQIDWIIEDRDPPHGGTLEINENSVKEIEYLIELQNNILLHNCSFSNIEIKPFSNEEPYEAKLGMWDKCLVLKKKEAALEALKKIKFAIEIKNEGIKIGLYLSIKRENSDLKLDPLASVPKEKWETYEKATTFLNTFLSNLLSHCIFPKQANKEAFNNVFRTLDEYEYWYEMIVKGNILENGRELIKKGKEQIHFEKELIKKRKEQIHFEKELIKKGKEQIHFEKRLSKHKEECKKYKKEKDKLITDWDEYKKKDWIELIKEYIGKCDVHEKEWVKPIEKYIENWNVHEKEWVEPIKEWDELTKKWGELTMKKIRLITDWDGLRKELKGSWDGKDDEEKAELIRKKIKLKETCDELVEECDGLVKECDELIVKWDGLIGKWGKLIGGWNKYKDEWDKLREEWVKNLLENEFIKIIFRDKTDYYLNPFASDLQMYNSQENRGPMWLILNGLISPQNVNVEERKNFKEFLDLTKYGQEKDERQWLIYIQTFADCITKIKEKETQEEIIKWRRLKVLSIDTSNINKLKRIKKEDIKNLAKEIRYGKYDNGKKKVNSIKKVLLDFIEKNDNWTDIAIHCINRLAGERPTGFNEFVKDNKKMPDAAEKLRDLHEWYLENNEAIEIKQAFDDDISLTEQYIKNDKDIAAWKNAKHRKHYNNDSDVLKSEKVVLPFDYMELIDINRLIKQKQGE